MPNTDSFKRGTVELVLLAVLQKEDLYGYQIVQRIAEKSEGNFNLPLGTLYPVLYRFTENGYITDHDEIVGKRLRKYYHLEESGKAYYKTLLSAYKKIAKGVELITEGEDPHDEV